MWMWLFEAKLKVKTALFRLPSASQKRVCLSSLICTYWLGGRAGRKNIWLEVRMVPTPWPRAKYFPVRPELNQSISILSYHHLVSKISTIHVWTWIDPTVACGITTEDPTKKDLSISHFRVPLCLCFKASLSAKTILMKMTLICMKMKLHAELIFIWKASHVDSLWNRGTSELGNGLLNYNNAIIFLRA